ncbi:Cu2+-exporting ATPase [Lachnospiraceae bacterium NE2001]|nr:Cu2+-exporting ATPase [Lachnospiraceae bacterium NE2001]SEQ99255.1 Cu2+-exporting ATPase [Lachnospiraceae bacterium NE2001]
MVFDMRKFEVNGMSCAACQARVEKAVSGVKGVDSCAVSLLTNSMGVEGSASDDDIIKAVEAAGYGASVMERALEDKESPKLVRRLVSSIGILLLLMYLSMGHMMLGWPVPSGLHNHVTLAIVEMILAIAVMVINNKFFVSGFRSLFHLAPNMDTLVALGSTASFGYSLVELFIMIRASSRGDSDTVMSYAMNLYFESAAMIPTLITIGKLLEAKAKGRTTNALKSLLALSPKEARVLRDGQEINVPVEDVKVGDIYILKAGDAVPVDGVVLEGTSAIDESALTGESIPVDKQQGDKVSAGTINTNGFLKCTATRVGEDTTLSQIIQMVGDAAATKAPLARIADKVSAIFVPTVMGLALLTFIVWVIIGQTPGFAIARAISVLVISCPCALGLATPVAIMVGNGVGAKNGILYKTAEALEGAGRVNAVILDKTGTITKGEPGVTDVIPADGVSSEELLTIAYSLEKMSEHPLARAVVDYVSDISTIELTNFETMAGAGIKAVVSTSFSGDGWNVEEGKLLEGGSLKYMKDRLHNSDTIDTANKLSLDGKTPLLFMEGERFLGIIAVADQVKEDSAEAINELKQMGIYTVMLTGDNEVTANAIAKKVFVDKVIAGVMPSQKEQVVASLQKIMSTNLKADSSGALKSDPKSYRVAMVGDGINDAVALTRADTGFAIGAGTDVAVEAADVVLMKNSIKDAAAAIRLSRKTITNIHQNLFWAFFYNALCIPLAMGVYGIAMKPMYGAAAMACSSVFVCLNALRLNLVRLYDSSKDKPLKKNNYQIDKCQIIDKNEGDNEMKKTIKIEGMMCPHCEATVKKALEALDGVTSAEASHEKGIAEVVLEKEVSDDILTKAVTDKDYTVVGIE